MPDFAITGKKGSGKSLYSVGVIGDALRDGKRVATNLDIYLDKLLPPTSKACITRIPDRPTVEDMHAIGRGQGGVCEEDNGIIVLDETSIFFNSRTFGDKDRQPLLDWLVHSRKYGWDVYYICQGLDQIDKQLRTTMIEYHVVVKRTDKWPIPFLTPFGKLFGLNIRMPKMHIGIMKYGVDINAMVCDRKFYKSEDFYSAYDTQQIFLDRSHPDACGLYTVLSPWLTHGRYIKKMYPAPVRVVRSLLGLPPFPTPEQLDMPLPKKTKAILFAVLFLAPVAAWAFMNAKKEESPKPAPAPAAEQKTDKVQPEKTLEDYYSAKWRLVGTVDAAPAPTTYILAAPDGRIRRYYPDAANARYRSTTLPDKTIVESHTGTFTSSSSTDRKP